MKTTKVVCDVCNKEIKTYLERTDSLTYPVIIGSNVQYPRINMCDNCKAGLFINVYRKRRWSGDKMTKFTVNLTDEQIKDIGRLIDLDLLDLQTLKDDDELVQFFISIVLDNY